MIYVKFTYDTPYAGTREYEYLAFPDDTPKVHLDLWAEEGAQDNGETFEYLVTGWEGDDPTEEELEDYYEGVTGRWEEISKEEWEENDGSIIK